jgi:choline dehydrogenase-like flavoprotein
MTELSPDYKKAITFDAIVIGTGISGGWAAKELCEKGLKTLVLDRGRNVEHAKDYLTAEKHPWEFEYRGKATLEQQRIFGTHFSEISPFTVPIDEQLYIQDKPFKWTRGYQVGGRSLTWARQTQRWSDFDFDGPLRDGYGVDWPVRYKEIAPWYSYVEKFAGISGNLDGLENLPDGEFLPPFEMNCVENHFRDILIRHYSDRRLVHGRCANITEPQAIHLAQGRAKCVNRSLCNRGCPRGGYFSSNSSTLPWARKTGNMTLRPNSVVHSIIYDDKHQRALGVRVIDTESKEILEFYSRIVFVNASALNSNLILLNSTSIRFPNGLGNDSGTLGKYICWHNYRGHMSAHYDGLLDRKTAGRRATPSYIPRFRNLYSQQTDFLRGYAIGFSASRSANRSAEGIGKSLKLNLTKNELKDWNVNSWMMGEVIPRESNNVCLDPVLKDSFGMPQLRISCEWSDNENNMVADFFEQVAEMYELAGFKNIKKIDTKAPPGADIHEMGGIRMGKDNKTSMLNKWNQLHACKNVFVTDGAFMTSSSTQNPSLTYMAFTARAANYAATALKKGWL